MIVLVKHVVLFCSYSVLFISDLLYHEKKNNFLPIASLYYLIMLLPPVHMIYVYSLVERSIPKFVYLLQCSFHIIYLRSIERTFAGVISILSILLLKDIIFLIKHAETRLAKIDAALYDERLGKRIAHLYKNVFYDDRQNRFHRHCFDTNKLYLVDETHTSREESLAIHNYRMLRIEGKKPRTFGPNDRMFYIASKNRSIFISHRVTYFLVPLFMSIWTSSLTRSYIHHLLVFVDLCGILCGKLINDSCTDFVYLVVNLALYLTTV